MENYENRTPEQWVAYYQGGYMNSMTLDTATQIIKSDMTNMARTCVSIGFHLKAVRDRELYREGGYENLWDYAADQFGLSLSSASRYISMNDQFSVGGNTPQLQKAYRNFSKSQLQEMITMSDEQKALVTEDMTVRDIRKIKNPKPVAKEEPEEQIPGQMEIADYPEALPDESVATSQKTGNEILSAYSLPVRTYPPDSLIAIPGCGTLETGGIHDCISCHMDGCQTRQEICYCVEAPMGNPFPCATLNMVDWLREDVGDSCQFVNHGLAFHRVGDHEPVPCCKDCKTPCEYECGRASKKRAGRGEQTERLQEKAGRRATTILTYLVEAAIEDFDFEKLYAEAESEDLFFESIKNLLFGDSVEFEFSNTDLRAEFFDTITIIKISTGKKIGTEYTWNQFFDELKYAGECGYEQEEQQDDRSVNNPAQVVNEEFREVEEPEEEELLEETTDATDLELAKKELEKSKDFLNAMLKCYTENDWRVRKQKLIVAALAGFICDLDMIENPPEKPEQPLLPVMKNNEQRKEWLRNYKNWGLWYEDEHIGCRYYRYMFENGAILVAEEYDSQYSDYVSYFHLFGGPHCQHNKYGQIKYQMHDRYNKYPNSESELVEFLKEIQKHGKK